MRKVRGTTIEVAGYQATATEDDWQKTVTEFAGLNGWECFHVYDSRRFWPGFPDWLMTREAGRDTSGRIIFVELKTETGVESKAQLRWRGRILYAGGEAYVWRPSDWETVQAVLR